MTTKECKKCKTLTDQYYKNSRTKDGYQSYCKPCSNKVATEHHKTTVAHNREDRVFDYVSCTNKKPLTHTQITNKSDYCRKRIDILRKIEQDYNNVIDSSFDELHRIKARIDKYELAISVLNNQDIVKQLINCE